MDRGSLREAAKSNRFVAGVLILLIAVVAVILGLGSPSKPWTVALQVITAVAGAALGNALRLDASQTTFRDHARPATRHLFDQVSRLRVLVQRAEAYQATIEEWGSEGRLIEADRTGDWFGGLGGDLRNEINSSVAAIEYWGDLAPEVQEAELQKYNSREQRVPSEQKDQTQR